MALNDEDARPSSRRNLATVWLKFGSHEISFEDPDVVVVRFNGDVTGKETLDFIRLFESHWPPGRTVFLLMDMTASRSLSSDARKIFLDFVRRRRPFKASLFFGTPPRVRAFASIFLNAARLLIGVREPAEFFDTEAQARAWIEQQRRLYETGATSP
jgi:hypothetical protein